MTRVLLFTGKGGVGKTTIAAATALRCARAGRRTLVVSTDPAHSLADAFDRPLDADPLEIEPRLFGQQMDATQRFEEAWGEVQRYLVDLLAWAGLEGIEAEELAIIPGLDELFTLSDIATFASQGTWDVLVVDCAPTAETIRLLSLPEVLSWYMARVFPASRRITRLVRPLVSVVSSVPVAGEEVFSATTRFYERLDGVRELLTDRERSSVRLVVNPERLVIAEARRTATYLSLFGYRVDAVIANRLLPEAVCDPWFDAWKLTHAEHLTAIEEGFAPIPVLRAELAPGELIGIEALAGLGEEVYGDIDAAGVLHKDEPLVVSSTGGGYRLTFALPFVERDDVELARHLDELQVRVGPYRRAVRLPDSLARRRVSGARLTDVGLEVSFDAREARDG